jgi:tetratricopeptide (TPR) repeat protein
MLGGALIVAGLVGTIYVFLDSDEKQRKTDEFAETTALLLTGVGLENPYTKIIQKELLKGGTHNYFLSKLDRVLAVTPNDVDALYLYSIISALGLSLQQRLEPDVSLAGSAPYRHTVSIVDRGIRMGKSLSGFYSAKGILLDIAKNHRQAREWYGKSGNLRTDPYWRLLCSTSYGMECDFENSFNELKTATDAGASPSITAWYYGRCSAAFGNYEEALIFFRQVKQARGNIYQLISEMEQCYWLSCRWTKAAGYSLLAAFLVVRRSRKAALKHLSGGVIALGLPIMMWVTRLLSAVATKVTVLRNTRMARLGNPGNPHVSMGLALMRQNKLQAAKKMFAIAAQRSTRLDAWMNYCTASLLSRDWDEAQRAYVYLLERWPEEIPEGYAAVINERSIPEGIDMQFDTLP